MGVPCLLRARTVRHYSEAHIGGTARRPRGRVVRERPYEPHRRGRASRLVAGVSVVAVRFITHGVPARGRALPLRSRVRGALAHLLPRATTPCPTLCATALGSLRRALDRLWLRLRRMCRRVCRLRQPLRQRIFRRNFKRIRRPPRTRDRP